MRKIFFVMLMLLCLLLCACREETPAPVMHTVKLDHNYINHTEAVQVPHGEHIAAPREHTRIGYQNDGWEVWEGGAWRAWNFSTDTVSTDLTLRQKRSPLTYTLYLDLNDGAGGKESIGVTYGEEYNIPTPQRQGYLFMGWFRGSTAFPTTEVTWQIDRDVYLQAAWSPYGYDTMVQIGRYEQDNDTTNGAEPIDWLILERSEDSGAYLLVSRYILEYLPFHDEKPSYYRSYRDRTLRTYLNENFYSAAFRALEKQAICQTHLQDVNTNDRIFLLNYEEIDAYLVDPAYATGAATAYVQAKEGFFEKSRYGGYSSCRYWVRYDDRGQMYMDTIGGGGGLQGGSSGGRSPAGIRPAMWVDAAYVDALLSQQ